MTSQIVHLAGGLALLVATGTAEAQVAPSPSAPTSSSPTAPSTTTPGTGSPGTTSPNSVTPPGGVARGVIRPAHPVDPKMVTRPPNHRHTMPVIKPPGTAR